MLTRPPSPNASRTRPHDRPTGRPTTSAAGDTDTAAGTDIGASTISTGTDLSESAGHTAHAAPHTEAYTARPTPTSARPPGVQPVAHPSEGTVMNATPAPTPPTRLTPARPPGIRPGRLLQKGRS